MGKTAKPRKRTHSSERKKGTTEQEDMNGTASCSGSAAGASATTPGRLVQSGLVDLDPELVYFTHSKIRPFFSGCGKKIEETIHEIKSGMITVDNLPTITVLSAGNGYFFSLNNRRLYVMKYLRENGYLADRSPVNTVKVRIKAPLARELLKYTPDKCSLKCKIMKERASMASSTINSPADCSEEDDEKQSPCDDEEDDGAGDSAVPPRSMAKGPGERDEELSEAYDDNDSNNSDQDCEEVPCLNTSSRMQALYVSDSSSSSEDN